MSIEIHCDNCHKRYRVKAELAGKRVRCTNCGNPLTVPNGNGNGNGEDSPAEISPETQNQAPPQPKRPAPLKSPPPPVPRQVVRLDPRFDPNAMSDIPAPPPAKPPVPKAPQRAQQPSARKDLGSARELNFIDDDPLSINKPRPTDYHNLADTADGPAIRENAPEPRLDEEPLIPRGKRGSSRHGSTRPGASKFADTADAAPAGEPDLDIAPPDDFAAFSSPQNDPMQKFRAEQAAGKERRCTGCGAAMKIGAVICLNCGFNTATGERGASKPADWDDAPARGPSLFSTLFGTGDWKPQDRLLRTLCIFGVIICLSPLIGLKVPQLIKPGIYIAYAGLALALLSAALFAKRMHFTRAAVAAAAAIISFGAYSMFRPLESDDQIARADDTPKVQPRQVKPASDTPLPKAITTDGPATSEVAKILEGPAEGIDPINWYIRYLSHADTRVRFKSANYLIEKTPPGRKEEVSRAFESRLADEHPQMRRLAIKGIALYIDDHTVGVLTPILKDQEDEVRADAYQLLARLKDTKALPAIVARLSDDGTLAREALAAFDASQRPAITRAFELSLKSDNPRQRELAARELANYGGPNTPGLLLGLLEDNDVGVRCAAVVTLGKLKDPRTLDAILTRLSYDRPAAIAALQAFGSGAEKPILTILKTSGSPEMRLAAAEILGAIGTRESVPALHDAAIDNDLRLSTAAREALRKIAPDEFTAAMEAAIDMESDSSTRQLAGLERLAELPPDASRDRVAKILVKMAMSGDPLVREAAYKVLPTWGTKDSAATLLDLLIEKTNPARRQLAELALGALKDPRGAPAVAKWAVIDAPASMQALIDMGPVAEPEVLELLNNERLDIRRDAVKALKAWGSKQRALPALITLLQKDRPNLGPDILEAIAAIRERPIIPRKPATQTKPVTQPAR